MADTKKNRAGEDQPVDEKQRYAEMSTAELKVRLSIKLPDEQLPRSLSAKWANEDILMPDGGKAHFVEGTKLHHIEIFAGKGCKREIDDAEKLAKKYVGSAKDDWQKVKGIGTIEYHGEQDEAEIHWYQESSVGRVEYKFKRYI